MKPRIRSSVAVVKLDDNHIEFFLGNTRVSKVLKVNAKIIDLICSLDGMLTIDEICNTYNMNISTKNQFVRLVEYLVNECILIDSEEVVNDEERITYSRVFSMLEDFINNENDLRLCFEKIKSSRVLIIGVGAVGSWVACNLVQSGVKNIYLLDSDVVELTNLHRQFGYTESDVGKRKTTVLKERLVEYNSEVCVIEYNMFLAENVLDSINECFDLIINCADKPSVDQTSIWVGEYCMKRNIPHIIAGGYNLHVTLIGQTIIPHKTACVKCFEQQLKKQNELETYHMKKMAVSNRKIGSFGPMCALSASISSLEAIKVLSGVMEPSNTNRRGDFNIYTMDTKYNLYNKIDECEWCGKNGKYRKTT